MKLNDLLKVVWTPTRVQILCLLVVLFMLSLLMFLIPACLNWSSEAHPYCSLYVHA